MSRSIEDDVVDLVLDAMGEMTLNECCQDGFREELANRIEGGLDKLLDGWGLQLQQPR